MRRSLTKNQIIRLKTDIDNVFKAGRRFSLSCFKLFTVPNGLSFSRIIVIPVRHYGNSVQRNTVRRQVKEIFRLNQDRIKKGLDFVVIVYPGNAMPYQEKEQLLVSLMEKSGSLSG